MVMSFDTSPAIHAWYGVTVTNNHDFCGVGDDDDVGGYLNENNDDDDGSGVDDNDDDND